MNKLRILYVVLVGIVYISISTNFAMAGNKESSKVDSVIADLPVELWHRILRDLAEEDPVALVKIYQTNQAIKGIIEGDPVLRDTIENTRIIAKGLAPFLRVIRGEDNTEKAAKITPLLEALKDMNMRLRGEEPLRRIQLRKNIRGVLHNSIASYIDFLLDQYTSPGNYGVISPLGRALEIEALISNPDQLDQYKNLLQSAMDRARRLSDAKGAAIFLGSTEYFLDNGDVDIANVLDILMQYKGVFPSEVGMSIERIIRRVMDRKKSFSETAVTYFHDNQDALQTLPNGQKIIFLLKAMRVL